MNTSKNELQEQEAHYRLVMTELNTMMIWLTRILSAFEDIGAVESKPVEQKIDLLIGEIGIIRNQIIRLLESIGGDTNEI